MTLGVVSSEYFPYPLKKHIDVRNNLDYLPTYKVYIGILLLPGIKSKKKKKKFTSTFSVLNCGMGKETASFWQLTAFRKNDLQIRFVVDFQLQTVAHNSSK